MFYYYIMADKICQFLGFFFINIFIFHRALSATQNASTAPFSAEPK